MHDRKPCPGARGQIAWKKPLAQSSKVVFHDKKKPGLESMFSCTYTDYLTQHRLAKNDLGHTFDTQFVQGCLGNTLWYNTDKRSNLYCVLFRVDRKLKGKSVLIKCFMYISLQSDQIIDLYCRFARKIVYFSQINFVYARAF